jgi:Putative transposase/Transposase zinc-binding domain
MQAQGAPARRLPFHEVLARWGPAYLQRFEAAMPARQREVLLRMLQCRTPQLGGSLYRCPRCADWHYAYHSCNDRHCPQCGQTQAQDWLTRQKQRLLLPVPYFLVTFTVPEPLREWIRSHPKSGYDLLFAASAQALQDLAANPKRLGGGLGMLGVLHTWSRTLIFHPHVHYLVPGGALSLDGRQWRPSPKKFLLRVEVLGQRFRTLFKAGLTEDRYRALAPVPAKVWKQDWVVHSQAVGSGHQALEYLSRYLFKTATGDRRVVEQPEGKLLWPYRESGTGRACHLPLQPFELIRRFLQHVLPRGYTRVRCFGFFHPAGRLRLNRVRALLKQKPLLSAAEQEAWQGEPISQAPEALSPEPSPARQSGPLCRRCGVPMILLAQWRAGQIPPRPWERAPPKPP